MPPGSMAAPTDPQPTAVRWQVVQIAESFNDHVFEMRSTWGPFRASALVLGRILEIRLLSRSICSDKSAITWLVREP